MLKAAAFLAVIAGLVIAPSAMAADKPRERPMGWFGQSIRSIVVFNSCTERLKEKFKIGPLTGIEVTHMDSAGAAPSGAMDVKFEATTTEKKTARKTHFSGVCHVGAEGETRIEARIVSQDSGGVVRRTAAG
jgi:hypothetical protein